MGKLGLTEEYIGSPLGLISINSKVLSMPVYNKAALLIKKDGTLEMSRVNIQKSFWITDSKGTKIIFNSLYRNMKKPTEHPVFYDLLFEDEVVSGSGRTIYQLIGNRIIKKITDQETVDLLPLGVTFSLPDSNQYPDWEVGEKINFNLPFLDDVKDAIEAGPMLVHKGKVCLDMEIEGWKTKNSIVTQAARLDYTHMRGPKMGAGITASGELILLAINGRTRESVGATHLDLAKILIKHGAKEAMGFDPGGSVTLVVDGKQLNVSPYNPDYESNIYSLPPVARTVGNAILGI